MSAATTVYNWYLKAWYAIWAYFVSLDMTQVLYKLSTMAHPANIWLCVAGVVVYLYVYGRALVKRLFWGEGEVDPEETGKTVGEVFGEVFEGVVA